jgi:hypothetical protein
VHPGKHAGKGHDDGTIGLSQFRDPKKPILPRLPALVFIGDPGQCDRNGCPRLNAQQRE